MSEKKKGQISTPAEALARAFIIAKREQEPEKDVSQGEP